MAAPDWSGLRHGSRVNFVSISQAIAARSLIQRPGFFVQNAKGMATPAQNFQGGYTGYEAAKFLASGGVHGCRLVTINSRAGVAWWA